jgi:hypothetical protein
MRGEDVWGDIHSIMDFLEELVQAAEAELAEAAAAEAAAAAAAAAAAEAAAEEAAEEEEGAKGLYMLNPLDPELESAWFQPLSLEEAEEWADEGAADGDTD